MLAFNMGKEYLNCEEKARRNDAVRSMEYRRKSQQSNTTYQITKMNSFWILVIGPPPPVGGRRIVCNVEFLVWDFNFSFIP